MEDTARLKSYLRRALNGEDAPALAYSAIERDDREGLELLIECGLNVKVHNFIFTAIDNSATKCFDLLLDKGANVLMGGRASNGNRVIYFEPLEYACILNNVDVAQKLVEHGAPLITQGGGDILRQCRKYIGAENCEKLLKTRSTYLDNHSISEKN